MEDKSAVGIIVGGGPAPGINGVISAATIEAINKGKKVIGLVGGFKALLDGERNALPLTIDDVSRIHSEGGSILCTSRDTNNNAKAKFGTMLASLERMGIKYLITIGGDGTLYMANWIEKEARGSLSVVHAPKTIDNDIPLPEGLTTFGYQTARHVGVSIVNNIIVDARTTGRWYFITVMGRHAGHLALGIGEASSATVTVIPEEFGSEKLSFKKVADILTGSIIKRLAHGKDHGVAILAEGIAEKFDPKELAHYGKIEKNEKGDIRLSEIPLGKLLKDHVNKTLHSMGIDTSIVDKNIGYELRAAPPIPYEMEYVRNLGYGSTHYLLQGGTGAMIVWCEGNIKAIPFVEMIDPTTGRIKIKKVDVHSETYEVARKYMIRLEKEDFSGKDLHVVAKIANMCPKKFKDTFEYVLEGNP
jgi:ATP-dependent phosphofructokinase / diphosphate-dependent phosphofructokinase